MLLLNNIEKQKNVAGIFYGIDGSEENIGPKVFFYLKEWLDFFLNRKGAGIFFETNNGSNFFFEIERAAKTK